MAKAGFNEYCAEFCDRLIAQAQLQYPHWETHPREKKPVSPNRYELNRRIKLADGGTVIPQYIFTPDQTVIALYLTMLEQVGRTCERLENARFDIEHACRTRASWEFNREAPIRFVIPAVRCDGILASDDSTDRLITHYVETMRTFQQFTLPLLGLAVG